jgi:hypothetical protein
VCIAAGVTRNAEEQQSPTLLGGELTTSRIQRPGWSKPTADVSLPAIAADAPAFARVQRFRDRTALAGRAEEGISVRSRPGVVGMVFVLYLATLTIDAIRKVTGLPPSVLGVVYVITAAIYIVALPGVASRDRQGPWLLPVWLVLLSLWCAAIAFIQRIPPLMGALGWASYVFFVPLAYVGAELTADDRQAARVLRLVTVSGVVVGAGAIASGILGNAAPALLQPLVPTVGIHSFNDDNVYLAPSVFATAEEASEQLLIALFAWAALAHLGRGRFRRMPSAAFGVLILGGLLITARRADIDVAVAGIIAVLVLGRIRTPASAWPHRSREATGTRGMPGVAILVAAAGSAALFFVIETSTLASFVVSGSAGSRIASMFSLTGSGSLAGQGPGTSTQGFTMLGASPIADGSGLSYILNGRTFITAEGGLTKTWLELGIMGVVLYAAVFWTALSPALRSPGRRDMVGVALTVLAIDLGVIFLKGHQALDDPLIQPLFWMVVGGIWGRIRAGRTTLGVSYPARSTE